jgi:Cupin-like domain
MVAPSPSATAVAQRSKGPTCLGPIDRHASISARDFYHSYYKTKKPVIIGGLTKDWPAQRLWTFEFFRERYGSSKVTCGRQFDKSVQTTVAAYLDYMDDLRAGRIQETHASPLYLEGWYFRRQHPELAEHYSMPEVYASDLWSKYFPTAWDPMATGLLIGPKGTFTKLHWDLMCTHSWNAQLVGSKRWILVSHDQAENTYMETRQGPGYFPGTDVMAPDLEKYPRMAQLRYHVGDVHPGETIFFPQRWFHEVTALSDSISLTHNYMSMNNLFPVMGAYVLNRFNKKNI